MFKFVSAIFLAGAAVLTDASKFKADHSLEKRSAESRRIKDKYPDRLPIIVEKAPQSDIPDIDKMKYLVPRELTVGQFVYVIRKRIQLPPEKAIFIFVNNVLPPTASLLASVFEGSKDEDGFLYVSYSGENTFGGLEGLEELDDEDWEAMLSDFDGLRN